MLPLTLAILGGLVLLYLIWTFNRMVRLRKQADNAWSDIDVQLKRRWDLVPALVETVKGYSRHEASTLEGVVSARKEAQRAESPAARGPSESTLTGAVHSIFALVEAYPDLKASGRPLRVPRAGVLRTRGHIGAAGSTCPAVALQEGTKCGVFLRRRRLSP
jgi:LemA protein